MSDNQRQRLDALSPAKRRLLELRREKTERNKTAIPKVSREQELPLSFAQHRQWLLHQFALNSPVYNAPEILRIRGPLDANVLESALNEVVCRHEVLRTTYGMSNGQAVQIIRPKLKIALNLGSVCHLPLQEREAAAKRLAQEEIRRPLDIAQGSVMRALLLQLAADDHLLVVTLHHIAYDGWSKTVFVRELATIYDALAEGRTHPLPELPIQYADYAVWQRNYMSEDELGKHLEFWRSELSGAPPSAALPTDYARPQSTKFEGASEDVLLPSNIVDSLRSISTQNGTTLFVTLLTVLDVLLWRWAEQRDLVVGTVVANRDKVETEDLIGCFINFLPLRCRISETDTASDLLQQVKKMVLQAYLHQDCPFEEIVKELNPDRAASATPFYNVVFLFQNYPQTAFQSRILKAEVEPVSREAAHMDLRIEASETTDGLRIACDYRSDLFSRATIKMLLGEYCSVARQLATDLSAPVSSFNVSGELQQQASISRARFRMKKVVVTSTFTAEMLEETFRFWMNELEMPFDISFAPFNQVFQSLLDPDSEVSANVAGLNVVLVRFEDWCADLPEDEETIRRSIERNADELITSLRTAAARSRVPFLLCICPPWRDTAAKLNIDKFLRDTEERIAESLGRENTIYVATSADLASLYPVSNYEDQYAYQVGRVPYTQAFFVALGTFIVRRYYRIHTPPYKVVALDCDETLWRGICGEEGTQGVQVDAACRALQKFVIAEREAGMLIVLCSKNNEADVWSVFEQNPGMLLKREHIAGYRIDWQPKGENLRALASELGLSLDSIIFLDDSAMECAQVESSCPEVLVLQLPRKEAELSAFLSHVWAFDRLKVTSEDRLRSEFYAQNTEREQLQKGSGTLDEFLASLDLQVQIRPMEKADVARVAQLTQRTNQFNFTGVRRTEAEIEGLSASGADCAVVSVRDRFGDYGLVGAIIYRGNQDAIELDSMLLSCRALGRRVEHRMLAHAGHAARERGFQRVRIRFVPTAKNRPAREFLDSIGAALDRNEGSALVWETPAETVEALHAHNRQTTGHKGTKSDVLPASSAA